MTINLTVPDLAELKPRITVFGVGGAGGNAVNNMIESRLEGWSSSSPIPTRRRWRKVPRIRASRWGRP